MRACLIALQSIWTHARSRTKFKAYFFPPTLIEDASHRLAYAALGFGFLVFMGSFGEFCYSQLLHSLDLWLELPPMLFLLALSAFVYWLARGGREVSLLTPQQAVYLGRFYLVVVCFVLAYTDWMPNQSVFEWTPGTEDMGSWHATGPSWVAVAVLFFTLILPATPRDTLITALVATTTSPLAWLISRPLYASQPAASELLVFFILHYVVCLMAWAQSFLFVRFISGGKPPRKVGAYKLVELLGEGGMGQVWKAHHALLARYAAVKLIQPEELSSSPQRQNESIARFRREARITATLTSPHTVALFDYGQSEEGRLFSVTEFLEGMDLGRMLDSHGPLPVGRTIHLLRQLCRSLEEAHGVGLVHRDIKPANLFIGKVGLQWDFLKVLDFGLVFLTAKANLTGEEGEDTLAFHGTIDFMAPEQIQGDEVDARTDLYSLGCVAYQMLSGERVFEGSTTMAVLAGHLTQAPDLLWRRSSQEIPAQLEELVDRCLQKAPAQRPPDARAIRLILEDLQLTYPWSDDQAQAWWAEVNG